MKNVLIFEKKGGVERSQIGPSLSIHDITDLCICRLSRAVEPVCSQMQTVCQESSAEFSGKVGDFVSAAASDLSQKPLTTEPRWWENRVVLYSQLYASCAKLHCHWSAGALSAMQAAFTPLVELAARHQITQFCIKIDEFCIKNDGFCI